MHQFIKICATGGVSSAVDDFNDIEFSPEEIRVIVEEAARHNTYVTAHCTGTEGTKQAIKNGVKCIEHGVLLDEECVQMMAEKNIPLVTTLSVSLGLADMKGLPDYMTKKAKALAMHQAFICTCTSIWHSSCTWNRLFQLTKYTVS